MSKEALEWFNRIVALLPLYEKFDDGFDDLESVHIIRAVLQSPQIDWEKEKIDTTSWGKNPEEVQRCGDYDSGWNDCLNHLKTLHQAQGKK